MIDQNVDDEGKNESDGLSTEEVNKKISEFGYNEIEEKKKSPLKGFFKKFWG